MSEHFDEQLSEFIDDEMSAEECEFFVRRLQRDSGARGRYLRYQLIGAVVRGEHIRPHAAARGGAVPGAGPARPAPARRRLGGRLAFGTGIAASVALVAVLGLRFANVEPNGTAPGPGGGLAADADSSVPPSYVVPASTTEAPRLVGLPAEVTGIQLLLHHTPYSSGLNRTLLHSSVVAPQQAEIPAETAAETAADAIE